MSWFASDLHMLQDPPDGLYNEAQPEKVGKCQDCQHWTRNHRLTEFGKCALCVQNPHMGPDSAHSSKGEWDYCPEFLANTELRNAGGGEASPTL